MEWLFDPTGWAGLVTLVFLELILGIDNLVFIAILAQKLPAKQRDRARFTGLVMALGMRIVLLTAISFIAAMTEPLVSVLGREFSGREIILLIGGVFLLWKATMEIHTRLEGKGQREDKGYKAQFWMVVAQIIVLDAIFSLDAVVTAVGMTEHLSLMITAVTIAIILMIWMSKPLTEFVGKHPTVVMLCLGFLLMVGFSLVAEGFGVHIPKGYLYAAIGFSVMIETINQFARARLKKRLGNDSNVRERAADAILKVLGAKATEGEEIHEASAVLQETAAKGNVLSPAEKELLRGVLALSERPVHTIMTPRMDIEWVNIQDPIATVEGEIKASTRSHLLVVDGEVDNVMGILRRDDYLLACLDHGAAPPLQRLLHEPLFVQKRTPVMTLLETFKRQAVEIAVVIDEFGSVEGLVTHLDLLEAIAGEFPDRDAPEALSITPTGEGSFTIDGLTSIYDVINKLGVNYTPDGRFATIAGLILHDLGRFPSQGDVMEWQGYKLTVQKMDGRRVDTIKVEKVAEE